MPVLAPITLTQFSTAPVKPVLLDGKNGHLNGVNGHAKATTNSKILVPLSSTLLHRFLTGQQELESYRSGAQTVTADGHGLSTAAITAAARYGASVRLDASPSTRERVEKNRRVMQEKIDNGKSVYGVSTGFGGSADTRTKEHGTLGSALLQLLHAGVLPSDASQSQTAPLPLSDPVASLSMPESWVRAAMLVRINALTRGHSGIRWELLEKMNCLLTANITPLVPLRGSISASGDLSPLSYIAGTLSGNPSIRVFDTPVGASHRQVVSSISALKAHNIDPLPLLSKEHLGILNGTAFSAALASLALHDALQLAVLSQVCTAMGTEALLGTRANYVKFIHDVARPHPGQIEVARTIFDLLEGSTFASPETHEEVTVDEDQGSLRQDRYPLRTSPQFLGPQIEDIEAAIKSVELECNTTTDNPLMETETGIAHNGGNFQAMAVTNAMEKTRLALHHIGKILFAQSTEMMNPTMNHGLPPNLAATDASLNYHTKGLDIATAAYVSELGYLANPVSTHIQSAEMHNQAVNSLALISCRYTVQSLETLSLLMASYLYALAQAMDLRAMQTEFRAGLSQILSEELASSFSPHLAPSNLTPASPRSLFSALMNAMTASLNNVAAQDAHQLVRAAVSTSSTILVDTFTAQALPSTLYASIPAFRERVSSRAQALLEGLRADYLGGARGVAPASAYLNRTRPVYEFIRVTLGVKMHGRENLEHFESGAGVLEQTIGQNVSLIYEAIRDGQMAKVIAGIFE